MIKCKVVILGDSGVGKSSILKKFYNNNFEEEVNSTIGCEFKAKEIELNSQMIKLLIWDTAGQEVFRCFTSNFLRAAKIAIIVYDNSNIKTLENIEEWIIQSKIIPNIKIVIIGNKSDINEKLPFVDDKIKHLKHKYSNLDICYYGNVSAKTGDNIIDLFYSIGKKILKLDNIDNEDNEESNIVNLNENKHKNICNC